MNAKSTDNKTVRKPGERRYKLYFRLMDISFAGILLFWALVLARGLFGADSDDLPTVAKLPLNLVLFVTTVPMPIFLIIARFMRDDYAEGLWRRTSNLLTYCMAIVPFVVIVVAWATYAFSMQTYGDDEFYKTVFGPIFDPQRGNMIITLFLALYLIAFVSIFQVLRWWDAR